jgi:hypothetical protein
MPNFALSHKAGPRRIERNLSFYCGGNIGTARSPVASWYPRNAIAPIGLLVGPRLAAGGLQRPLMLAAMIVGGGLLGGAVRTQSPDLGAPSIGILPPPNILESVRYLGLDP